MFGRYFWWNPGGLHFPAPGGAELRDLMPLRARNLDP